MVDEGIPEDVKRLILERIDSVAQLEAVLLLRGSPREEWTADHLAKRLYISSSAAATLLADMQARGFFAMRREGIALFRYDPASVELEAAVDRLAEAYKHRLIAVTNLIHSKPGASVQRFADAFRVRKDI